MTRESLGIDATLAEHAQQLATLEMDSETLKAKNARMARSLVQLEMQVAKQGGQLANHGGRVTGLEVSVDVHETNS